MTVRIDDIDSLLQYRRQGPHAHMSAPTAEYLDPLFFVLGANQQGDRIMTLFEGFHSGALSMRTCLLVGRRKDDLRLPDELVNGAAERVGINQVEPDQHPGPTRST